MLNIRHPSLSLARLDQARPALSSPQAMSKACQRVSKIDQAAAAEKAAMKIVKYRKNHRGGEKHLPFPRI